jgi:hypothetical protein
MSEIAVHHCRMAPVAHTWEETLEKLYISLKVGEGGSTGGEFLVAPYLFRYNNYRCSQLVVIDLMDEVDPRYTVSHEPMGHLVVELTKVQPGIWHSLNQTDLPKDELKRRRALSIAHAADSCCAGNITAQERKAELLSLAERNLFKMQEALISQKEAEHEMERASFVAELEAHTPTGVENTVKPNRKAPHDIPLRNPGGTIFVTMTPKPGGVGQPARESDMQDISQGTTSHTP